MVEHLVLPTDRPYVFFDTSFVGVLLNMVQQQRACLAQYVWHEWRYAISPITMIELVIGLHRGADDHWDENRSRFAILQEPDLHARILDLPQEFLAQAVFGKRTDPDSGFAPWKTRLWFEQIAGASTREQLKQGVFNPTLGEHLPFDAAVIEAEVARLKAGVTSVMTGHRDRRRTNTAITYVRGNLSEEKASGIPSQRMWTAGMLAHSGIEATPPAISKAQPRLDAAYRYQRWQYANAPGTYRPEKDDSAWADILQLIYLSDPTMHVVAADKDHVERTKGTSQRSQILTAKVFEARAGV